MAFLIELNEGTAGRRTVPFRLFTSNGTSPDTNASNGTMLGSLNGAAQLSLGSISAVSANAGLYSFAFSQSNVSVLGSWALYTDTLATDFPQHVATVQVVNSNPFSTQSNVGAVQIAAGTYSSVSVRVQAGDYGSIVTMGVSQIAAKSYSGVTIQGVSNTSSAADVISDITGGVWYAGSRSGVTVGAGNIAPGTYSGVTVGINNIAAGSFSGVTIQGVTRVNSSVTPANATYSGVTVRIDPQAYSGLTVGVNNIAPASYSGVSVEIAAGGIQSSSFGGNAIDAAALATDAGQELADRWSARNIAGGSDGGRTNAQAMAAIRNRVFISGSTGTVYGVDDTTSAWTFSVTTTDAMAITDINPAG